MRLHEIFYAAIGRNEDYSLRVDHDEFFTLSVTIEGLLVRVEADFRSASTFVWESPLSVPEPQVQVHSPAHIFGFRAIIQTESMHNITPELSQQCRRAAFEALQRVVIHLRNVTNDPSVDVYLSTFHTDHYEISDDLGRTREEGNRDHEHFISEHVLTEDDWDLVTDRVVSNVSVPLQRDLILTARSFFASRNYSMALVNAAIACEMLLYRLIDHNLVYTGILPRKALDRANNPQRTDIALRHKLIAESQAADLKKVFRERNDIVHWNLAVPTSQVNAQTAVRLVQEIETLLLVI